MNRRLFAIAGLAAITAATAAHADIALFGSYWENTARAARQNDAALVRQLAPDGPNQTDEEVRTGLHYAAMNGNLQIMAILLKAGAKLDPVDKLGNSPLHWAADRGQTPAAELLIQAGAAIDPENRQGRTPLMIAAARGNMELVRLLLAKGASATKTDYTGRDAASWAQDSRRPAIVDAIRRAIAGRHS